MRSESKDTLVLVELPSPPKEFGTFEKEGKGWVYLENLPGILNHLHEEGRTTIVLEDIPSSEMNSSGRIAYMVWASKDVRFDENVDSRTY